MKLENRPQQFVDKWAAECSLRWFRAFQPEEALNCIRAAFTVGARPLQPQRSFGDGRQSTNKSFAISTRMRRRSSAPRHHISSGIVSCAHLATCTSEGAHVSGSHSAEALRASHLQSTYSKNGARKTWAMDMVCAAVSHRGGCASHAGGLMLLSRAWRDTLSLWMNPKCSCTSMV